MKRITVSQIYLNLLSDYLEKVGTDHLPNTGDGDKGETCTDAYKTLVDLPEIEKVIAAIEKKTGDRSFGLKIGSHIHPSDYGAMGYALMNFPDLHQALYFAAQNKHLLNEAFATQLVKKGSRYHYQTKNIKANPNLFPLIELDFSSAIQLARFFVGADRANEVQLIQVNFQHDAFNNLEDYQRVFNCPVKFGQPVNEFVLSKHTLDIPIRSANPQMLNMLLRKFERWKKDITAKTSFSQRVIGYITSQNQPNMPISTVASEFNISVSTLKKRLHQEELNYSTLSDAIRKKVALKMMLSPATQIKEVYIKLNFASSSAFNRAFKRWTNMTPTEYRNLKTKDNGSPTKETSD